MPRLGRVQAVIDAGKARRELERERRASLGYVSSAAENDAAMKKVADFEAKSKVAREEMLIERAKMRGVSSAAISEAKSKGLDIGNLQPGAFEARKAATFDVNKGGMQKAQAKPGMSNSEVIAAAQARLASGTRTPEDAKWDRKLIQASRDRMKIAGETESVPADISDRQLGFVRRKGQFISKPTDEDIGHSRRAEEMRTQLALSQQRIDATPPAPTRAPTFIPPPIMGSESRLEANTAKVAASTASAETVMSGRTNSVRAAVQAKLEEIQMDRIAKNAGKVASSTAAVKTVTAPPPAPVQPSLPSPPPKDRYVDPTPAPTAPSEIAQFEAGRAKEEADQKDYDKRYRRKSEPYVHKPLETPKVELRKDILRRLDARVDENFRPDYDDEDGEDPGRPTNRHSIAVDKLRKDLKYAERNGDSRITTKIPSYSEMTLSYEEAHALIGESEGYPEGSVQRGVKESIDKANAVRATLDKPMEVQGSLNGKPFRHVFKTGADAKRFIEEQRGWDMDEDDEDFYGRKPESKLKIDRKATVESVPTNKRDKLANQVQKAIASPDKSKLPADPFQGFRGDKLGVAEKLDEARKLTDPLARAEAMDEARQLAREVDAEAKAAAPKKPMSDKQKEALAKAHAAVRARSAAKKEAAAATGGQKKFDAIRGGGRFDAISSGTGGPGGSGQKRVPAGNPTGGRWTK